jgi:threonylcarbamoyladenosine tRNA methylthiotransferase MtaB
VPLDDVVKQVNKLGTNGYPEIVLTGIHIGHYGRDFTAQIDLLTLLKEIRESGFVGRLRLGSVEPTELPEDLYHYVADSNWICPYFHIPMQSGDDDILKRMNRTYSATFFSDLIKSIHESRPDTAIGLDVITGFPGETKRQAENTFRLLEDLPFSHLHVFPFSKRVGTPAATMADQISGTVVKERAAYLRKLGERKFQDYSAQFIGKDLEIVIESGSCNGYCKGLSQNGLSIRVPAESVEAGGLVGVKVIAQQEDGLTGEVL